jgi:hypothetical protein
MNVCQGPKDRGEERTHGKPAGDDEREEGQTANALIEVVDAVKDEWEGLEPEVEDSINEAEINIGEGQSGLLRQHERPHKRLIHDAPRALGVFVALFCRSQLRVTRELPQALGAPKEDGRPICLRQQE